jgi:hypothetical protein
MRADLVSRPGFGGLGVRSETVPPWIVQDEYEWLWLYAAVEPTTGTCAFLLLPSVESHCLQLFGARTYVTRWERDPSGW